MKLKDLIREGEYVSCELDFETEVVNITSESTLINSGTLFVIPNSNKIPDFKINPLAVLCANDAEIPEGIPTVRAKEIRRLISFVYFRFYGIKVGKMKMIAVTGTNGKTTTASFIEKILTYTGNRVGFIGTGKIAIGDRVLSGENYSMTTPDPELLYRVLSLMQNDGCEAVVMEASSHALALDKLAPLEFDYGVFTNLSSEHLDFHPSKEEYFLAKKKLFQKCKCAVLNIDDPYARRLSEDFNGRVIRAGVLWRGDIYATQIENTPPDGLKYLYHGRNFIFFMRLQTSGIYNVYNSLLASAVCIDMGIKPKDAKIALSEIPFVEGRFEIIKDRVTVIIDYAHTDSAFESVMKNLSAMKHEQNRLTVLFGCGGERDRQKRPKMASIAEKYADRVIVTSDNSRGEDPMSIISDITLGFTKENYEIIENRREAIIHAVTTANDGDIVALIGKGAEKYNIDSNGYSHFDEKEIASFALSLGASKAL